MMDRWDEYFFRQHSEGELRGWAGRLKLFRYVRASGSHANDADSLEVAYAYHSVQDIINFFAFLGVELVQHTQKPPQPEIGVSYFAHKFAAFPSLIRGTEWIEQPGRCEIEGVPVFAWCAAGKIRPSVCSDDQDVTSGDVAKAEALEKVLANAPLRVSDPPRDDKHCLCPKYYPDFFEQEPTHADSIG